MNPSRSRESKTTRPRLPEWLRAELPAGDALRVFNRTDRVVESGALHTVCEEARCPNVHDCWGRGTATFMIAGKECTRGCRFCSVETLKAPAPPDTQEPARLAEAVEQMGLKFVVITVVNRDDLPDGGAGHYRACVEAIHKRTPDVGIELLGSDLAGDLQALLQLLGSTQTGSTLLHTPSPLTVFAHNVECVPRLDAQVRDPRASFDQSLAILREAKRLRPDLATKSSLMVGLGESDDEIIEALERLRREATVDLVTLGQYLTPGRPGERFLPVDRYVPPATFDDYATAAYDLGFKAVASGPLVRSSFRAGVLYEAARSGKRVEELLDADPTVVAIQ